MPNVNEMVPSKFLKKEDFPEPVTLTIKDVSKENVGLDNKPEYKWVMRFREVGKPLVLNKTNIKRAAKACGSDDSDDWIGKKIVVYNDEEVEFGGEQTGGIRLRAVPRPQNRERALPQVEGGMEDLDGERPF